MLTLSGYIQLEDNRLLFYHYFYYVLASIIHPLRFLCMAQNDPMLILNEATNSVDTRTEI